MRRLNIIPLLPSLLAGGFLDAARTPYPREVEEEKGPPRQPEVNELGKKARKIYSKVMRVTGDRDQALEAARKV